METEVEIPESLKAAMQEVQQAEQQIRQIIESAQPQIKDLASSLSIMQDLGDTNNRTSLSFKPDSLIREENAQKRHAEDLKMQALLFGAQSQILTEQKGARNESRWFSFGILAVSTLTLLATAVLILQKS
jgi:hypothetical protein